jgi:serine/threonine-protein kinase
MRVIGITGDSARPPPALPTMSDSRPPVPSSADSAGSAAPAGVPPAPSEWLRAELGALSAMLPPSAGGGAGGSDGGAPDLLPTLQAALGQGLELERELGGGGMSRVFVAMDTTLGRRVAVKVLAPELLQGVSADRFAREVALAARLQDPHIVPVLTTGATAGGIPYYTMPFIEGESLRGRMQRAKDSGAPVPLDEALRILRDVAEALEYAHARGVVHRDIKPENVLLSGRNALVADFGIAKAMTVVRDAAVRDSAAHSTSGRTVAGGTLTSVGLSLGTPGYMAPEQAGGDVVDHRADLYAWGLMAWELLAGRHPFADKQSSAQLMAAQLAEMPRSLDEVRPGLPPSLGALVMRCVAKLPAERPADVAAVLAALGGATTDLAVTSGRRAPVAAGTSRRRTPMIVAAVMIVGLVAGGAWWVTRGNAAAAASPADATPSIAVLPFEHQGDSTDTYLTDGITDEIRNKLTGVQNLVVIARASSMQYKGKATSPQGIAKELGVRWLLTGTVRVLGTGDQRRVLVRPELVEVTPDGRLQSKGGTPFDGPLTDVVKAQGEVASQVVGSMEVTVGGADQAKLVQVATTDPVAYDLYLRGLAAIGGGANTDVNSMRTALEFFEQAVKRDSTLIEAWGAIGRTYLLLYANATPSPEFAARARAAVARLERFAPASATTLRTRSLIRRALDRDYNAALADLRRALTVAPSDPAVLNNLAGTEADLGRLDEALSLSNAAIRIDPRTPPLVSQQSRVLLRLRRFAEARSTAARAAALAPTSITYAYNRIMTEVAAGDLAAARQLYQQAITELPRDRVLAHVATYYEMWWVPPEADQQRIVALPADAFGGDFAASMPTVRAQVYEGRGQLSQARAWADTAIRALQRDLRGAPNNAQYTVILGHMLALRGDSARAMESAQRGLALADGNPSARLSAGNAYLYVVAARAAVHAGDRARAIEWLRKGLALRGVFTAPWIRLDPSFAPLKGDPAFERVLAEAP